MIHIGSRKRTLLLLSVLLFLLVQGSAFARPAQGELATLVDIAGQQRMLSQKIAKAYFFHGLGVRPDKTRRQLTESLEAFNRNFERLKRSVKDDRVQEMLAFLELAKEELSALVMKPYSRENAALVLDYSETLLEGSQDIVKRLEERSRLKKEAIVDLAGRQRMLAQRIAKLYIAYQAGFRDPETAGALRSAVEEFEQAHERLRKSSLNTPEIDALYAKVEKLWNAVARFYKDVERGGLPVIVLTTTDRIMENMDTITHQYAARLDGRQASVR